MFFSYDHDVDDDDADDADDDDADDDDDDDDDDDLSKISTPPPTAIFGFGFRGIDWSFVQNLRGLLRNCVA